MTQFFTIGHSTRTLDEFIAMLREAGVGRVVDVRKMPGSRTNPQFNGDTLAPALAEVQIAYEHIAGLGGLRGKQVATDKSPNGLWRVKSFQNYADYALTKPFADAFARLKELGRSRKTVIMCAEAVWWRCHRRLIADNLIASGETVLHIMGLGRLERAKLTPGAVVQPDGRVLYPSLA